MFSIAGLVLCVGLTASGCLGIRTQVETGDGVMA